MLTGMTDADWTQVVEIFRACRSRRGDKGRDDRKFLEAMHYFSVHNVTWRALPATFGKWNSVWKRCLTPEPGGRVRGVLRGAREPQPHRPSRADVRLHGGPRARLGGRRQRGQDDQALGRSRGGFSTKIHLKVDLDGLPLAFHLTEGQAGDSPQFEVLLDLGPDITPRAGVGDKGYDSNANRAAARERGICPVIPYKSSAKERPTFFPKALSRARARIEQLVGKLKRFKRVALRCEKTSNNYGSIVAFTLGLIIVKSVHTA
jgi:transposase